VARITFTTLCACALLGCYGSSTVVGPQTAALHRGEQGEDAELVADDGSSVRLDGNSELRFTRSDGTTTSWIVARDLLVNDDGVFVRRDTDDGDTRLDGLRWLDVQSVEVRNLNRGETMVAVVAITAAVVGIIAIASNCKGKIPFPDLSHVNFHVSGSSSGGGGSDGGGDEVVTPSSQPSLGEPDLEKPSSEGAHDLLDDGAKRKSVLTGVATLEGGGETTASGLRLGTAMMAVRLFEFLDFGAGARWISFGVADTKQSYVLPVFRFGMHADLDAARRFAVVFGAEMGANESVLDHVRVDWGVRFRIYDQTWLGIDPLTPVYDRFKRGITGPAWSAPSTIQLAMVF
jgi:hypothetical protein